MKLLFVCLGNICRSPMAAGIMRKILAERGLPAFVDSAGTADWNEGSGADQRAVQVCLENDVDIRGHRARQLKLDDFGQFDLILVMDRHNLYETKRLCPASLRTKIRRLGEFCSHRQSDVGDPYHGNRESFKNTFDLLKACCDGLAEDLLTENYRGGKQRH